MRQRGEKGNPVYMGASTARNAARYWRWPYWDKDSVYLLTSTRLGADNVLKTRLYHDTYKMGVGNLGDKWYQFSDGYPMPGRSYYLDVGYRF